MIGKAIIWDFVGRVSNQGVSFFISIFLARLLLPEDFALIGLVMAFIGIAGVFVDLGLGSALIQREHVSQIQYSSIFWLNILLALIMSISLFFSARLIASFYKIPELVELLRILSLSFLMNAIGGIHRTMVIKDMDFQYLAKTTVISSSISGIIGIMFAIKGFGVWSLVIQNYSANILSLILLWYKTKWLPNIMFSWKQVRPLWNYSKHLFFSGLLSQIFSRLDIFIIGKLFLPATLGFYSRGKDLNQLIINYSSGSLGRVLFPALSKEQHDLPKVKNIVVEFYHLALLLSLALSGLLFIVAEDLIVLLFTKKWLPSVFYFRVLVISLFVYPTSIILLESIKALGESRVILKLDIVKKILILPTYAIGFYYGIETFMYLFTISRFIAFLLNSYVAANHLLWPMSDQLKEVIKYILIILPITFIIWHLNIELLINPFLRLLICTISFMLFLISLLLYFRAAGFIILKDYIFEKFKSKFFE